MALSVAFPIFPGAEELDLAGPWEALALARDYGEREIELFTVALTSTQTKTTLGVGLFTYDVQRTTSGSETVLSTGRFVIKQEVLF